MIEREAGVDVFSRAAEELDHLTSFVALTESALRMASQSARVLDLLERGQRVVFQDTGAKEAAFRAAKQREEYAAQQLARGNPYLYGLASIQLWTIIESFIDGLLHHLLTTPEVRRSGIVAELRGPVVAYAEMPAIDQTAWLVDALKETLRPMHKKGVGQFECLLEAVGSEGGVVDPVRRALLELQQVRHVLVHRSGRVDHRLLGICPWIDRQPGQDLGLDAGHFRYYHDAVMWYLVDVSRRTVPLRLSTPSDHAAEFIADADSALHGLLRSLEAHGSPWPGRGGVDNTDSSSP